MEEKSNLVNEINPDFGSVRTFLGFFALGSWVGWI